MAIYAMFCVIYGIMYYVKTGRHLARMLEDHILFFLEIKETRKEITIKTNYGR